MEIHTKYLQKLKAENTLTCLYTDHFNESYDGYVLDFTDEFLIFEKVDTNFKFDGICILYRNDITRIRWAGNDLQSISKLIDLEHKTSWKSSMNLENINSLIVDLAKEFSVLTIYTQHLAKDICFVGQVEEIDNNTLLFHEFGTTSTLDRKFLLISVEEITKIEVNGHYEKNITKLFGLSK